MYNYFDLGLRIFYKKKYIEKAYIFFTSIFFLSNPWQNTSQIVGFYLILVRPIFCSFKFQLWKYDMKFFSKCLKGENLLPKLQVLLIAQNSRHILHLANQ